MSDAWSNHSNARVQDAQDYCKSEGSDPRTQDGTFVTTVLWTSTARRAAQGDFV